MTEAPLRPAPASISRCGSWWAAFQRVHLVTLANRRLATTLVVGGIGLGTALFVAIVILLGALGRPFSALTDAIAGRASLQVTPAAKDRLPAGVARTARGIPGVDGVVPVVGGLTTLRSETGGQGALLIGTDCSIERLLGSFDCRHRFDPSRVAPGPGVPLAISHHLAHTLGVHPGDTLGVPGGFMGDAHVGVVFDDSQLDRLNGGMVAVGLVPDVQDLLVTGPHLSALYVRTSSPETVSAALERRLGPSATVGPPRSDMRLFFTLIRALVALASVLVLVGGVMVAVNSFTLSLDDRRMSLAIVEVLGSSPWRTISGVCGEGALLGGLGGIVAILPGYLLGTWLTASVGRTILAGTGASLTAPFRWWLPPLAIATGLLCGLGASVFPAIRLVREGALTAISQKLDVLPSYDAPRWPVAGFTLVLGGVPLVAMYGEGRLPLLGCLVGVTLAFGGLLLGFFGLTPWLVALFRHWTRSSGAIGILAAADLARDPLRLAAVVTTVGLGVTLAVGSASMRVLSFESMAQKVSDEIGGWVFVFPRDSSAQTDSRFSPEALAALARVPGVASVSAQSLQVLASGPQGMNVLGTDPNRHRRNLRIEGTTERRAWAGVARGEVIVSRLTANRLGLRAGGTLSLPTTRGRHEFRVAAIAVPSFGADNGIAELVVVSAETAARFWDAATEFAFVVPERGVSAHTLAERIRRGSGIVDVHTFDKPAIAGKAATDVSRFTQPLELAGFTLLAVALLAVTNFFLAGQAQRRWLRAALRLVGYEPTKERKVLLVEALFMGAIGALFGIAGSLLLSWLTTLASPALLAAQAPWHVIPMNLGVAVLAAMACCLVAVLPSTSEAGNLDVLAAITGD